MTWPSTVSLLPPSPPNDMARLLQDRWLNDEVVNFYMMMMQVGRGREGGSGSAVSGFSRWVEGSRFNFYMMMLQVGTGRDWSGSAGSGSSRFRVQQVGLGYNGLTST